MSRLVAVLRLALFLALVGGFGLGVQARESSTGDPALTVALSDLPAEARHTLDLIQRGGPFPFPHKDGSTFGNFEKRLPSAPRGYYREYTVPTPDRQDRGARRIIVGGSRSAERTNSPRSVEYYYTGDHYRSFRRIRQP